VLDLQDGSRKGVFEAGAPLSASPAQAGARRVIGTQEGRVFCLR
jgi:hypothetical protein